MLEIETLSVAYGAIQALRGVSLSVGEGSIVTLIGANGAGKTTLLRTISGLLRPGSGRVAFDGRDITGRPGHPGEAGRRRREARSLPRPRGAPELRGPHGQGQPPDRRLSRVPPPREGRGPGRPGARGHALPRPPAAPAPDGRHALRRRAADAGHRPRPHGAAAPGGF